MTDTRNVYIPLWNASKGVITSYLYSSPPPSQSENDEKKSARNILRHGPEIFSRDIQFIKDVNDELADMAEAGRRLLMICPIDFQSIDEDHLFLEYIVECQKVAATQRRYLIFMIKNLPAGVSETKTDKRVTDLKKYAYKVYGQTENSDDISFSIMQRSGFDAVGFSIDPDADEKKSMQLMESYARRALRAKIPELFLLNVTSLSLATAAVCSNYTYLGGAAIHAHVEKPDHIYRFENEHLFKDLMKDDVVSQGGK